MNEQDTKIVKIEWTTLEHHSGYFHVPKDFDQNNYDMGNGMADHDEDTFEWLERDNFEVYNQQPPPGSTSEIIDIDLEGHEVDR